MTNPSPPPPGWYPDPHGGTENRYWTGTAWAPAPGAPAPPSAPAASVPADPGKEKHGWNKKLTAVVATATAVVGLTSGVVALGKDLFSFGGGDDTPAAVAPAPALNPAAPSDPTAETATGLTPLTAEKLETNVQLSSYEQKFGKPVSKERLQNDEWQVSTWATSDIRVDAFSDRNDQVLAYMLTSLSPNFGPVVKYLPGGIRLRSSVFTDTADAGVAAGVFPPNARWWYEEYHVGAAATEYKSVVLAASYAANADDAAATEITGLRDCLGFSVFESSAGCPPDRVEKLRSGLHITSMTVGESAVLEALAADGAEFHPPAD